jgi:hypothetical protein
VPTERRRETRNHHNHRRPARHCESKRTISSNCESQLSTFLNIFPTLDSQQPPVHGKCKRDRTPNLVTHKRARKVGDPQPVSGPSFRKYLLADHRLSKQLRSPVIKRSDSMASAVPREPKPKLGSESKRIRKAPLILPSLQPTLQAQSIEVMDLTASPAIRAPTEPKSDPKSTPAFSVKAHLRRKLQRTSDNTYHEHLSRAADLVEQHSKNSLVVRTTSAVLSHSWRKMSVSSIMANEQSSLNRASDYYAISTNPLFQDSKRSQTSIP